MQNTLDLKKKKKQILYRIRHDLICYGDRFTEKEAYTALEEAPIGNKSKPGEPPMIDYQGFCKILGGLRKKRKPSENWIFGLINKKIFK